MNEDSDSSYDYSTDDDDELSEDATIEGQSAHADPIDGFAPLVEHSEQVATSASASTVELQPLPSKPTPAQSLALAFEARPVAAPIHFEDLASATSFLGASSVSTDSKAEPSALVFSANPLFRGAETAVAVSSTHSGETPAAATHHTSHSIEALAPLQANPLFRDTSAQEPPTAAELVANSSFPVANLTKSE